jgi:hypothetical protein
MKEQFVFSLKLNRHFFSGCNIVNYFFTSSIISIFLYHILVMVFYKMLIGVKPGERARAPQNLLHLKLKMLLSIVGMVTMLWGCHQVYPFIFLPFPRPPFTFHPQSPSVLLITSSLHLLYRYFYTIY